MTDTNGESMDAQPELPQIRFGPLLLVGHPEAVEIRTKRHLGEDVDLVERKDIVHLELRMAQQEQHEVRWEIGLALQGGEWRHLFYHRDQVPFEVPAAIEAWGRELQVSVLLPELPDAS